IGEYPVTGRFIKEAAPAKYTKYQTRFYDMFNEFDMLAKKIDIAQRDGEYRTAAELRKMHRKDLAAYTRAKGIKKRLAQINKQIKEVWLHKTMKPEIKRKRLDALQADRNRLTKNFYDWYMNKKP
ncbi:MAG: hypothetical protein HKO79_01045, partial [Desulfobacterales bacterium]|nr:hypothetical protein [Desulfobacterales bacterium]